MSAPYFSGKVPLGSGLVSRLGRSSTVAVIQRTGNHYRSDIDGLRAVAIVPVVLFHLGVPFFGGGFVGVDVFFVISGFLITSIIYGEMLAGNFSFLAFYERRIRRLFPAMFCVLAVTLIVATLLMLPLDFKVFSQSVVAASVFGANLLFWKTAGYFDGPAEMKPLLHTWTLSVEEQFYIFYPLLLFLLLRFLPRHAILTVAGLAVLSLVTSIVSSHVDPNAVFYLPHFRGWELLLGALLAMPLLPQPESQRVRDALSLAGLGMIGYSVLAFSKQTVFPGGNALYPCLGAGLLLYAGSGGHSLVGRVLSLRPFVWVGLISYSLYLWHWPLIVFAKYLAIRELTSFERVVLLVTSLLLATLSWRYVERPFRGKSGLFSRPVLFGISAAAMVMFIAIGLAGHIFKGFPERLPQEVVRLASRVSELDPYLENCVGRSPARVSHGDVCKLGNADPALAPRFLLWGDSHGAVLASAFDSAAQRAGRKGLFVGKYACPPLLGIERYDSWHACRSSADAVTELIKQNKSIDTVMLAGRWAFYVTGSRYGAEDGKPVVISPEGISGNRAAFQQGLERTLQLLSERNIAVVFVTQVPEIGWHVPSGMARAALFGRSVVTGPSVEAYHARQRPVSEVLNELSARHRFRVFDISPALCPGSSCLVEQAGQPLYRDGDHLSEEGARIVGTTLSGTF